jgi:hypothetical protein
MAHVAFIASDDYANISYSYSECLRAVGVDTVAVKQVDHPYHYPKQAAIIDRSHISAIMRGSKILIFMQGQHNRDVNPKNFYRFKRMGVFYGGSNYRNNNERYNKIFNPFVDFSLIQTMDLFDLGAKNPIWIKTPVDTNTIQPVYRDLDYPIVIGHFPRSRRLKNTPVVAYVFDKLEKIYGSKAKFVICADKVDWKKNIDRMSKCDVIVESLMMNYKGHAFGEPGVTAYEAAALGKIVVTVFNSFDKYRLTFGALPRIFPVQDAISLETTLVDIITRPLDYLTVQQRLTRAWIEDHHSFAAVGKDLKPIIIDGVDDWNKLKTGG